MKRSENYNDDRFHNSLPTEDAMSVGKFFGVLGQWIFEEGAVREPRKPIPTVVRRKEEFDAPLATGLRITWIGHSTLLVEIDGYRVLTDPIWSQRASPVSFVGVTRFHPPPLPLDELPKIDAVVLSHDHYDHLDESTIRALNRASVSFLVPLGVGARMEPWGIPSEKIKELDWWEETAIGDLRLVCTPARHFSGRGLFDRDETLWASWAIVGPEHRVYFSGDSGMFSGFFEIGEKLGPFDATLMEVGAYNSLWADLHMGPEQAVDAHLALRGKLMFPIHWGTFNLAMHSWTEPVERMMTAARDKGVQFAIPQPGQSVEPTSPPEVSRWWPDVPWQTASQAPVVSSGLARTMVDLP